MCIMKSRTKGLPLAASMSEIEMGDEQDYCKYR